MLITLVVSVGCIIISAESKCTNMTRMFSSKCGVNSKGGVCCDPSKGRFRTSATIHIIILRKLPKVKIRFLWFSNNFQSAAIVVDVAIPAEKNDVQQNKIVVPAGLAGCVTVVCPKVPVLGVPGTQTLTNRALQIRPMILDQVSNLTYLINKVKITY